MKKILLTILILSLVIFVYHSKTANATNETLTGTTVGTWMAPPGVTQIVVEVWGGGGSGGGTQGPGSDDTWSGGGAGGSYAQSSIDVTPGNTYNYYIARGAVATGISGTAGEDTMFISSTTILAKGGGGGTRVIAGGGVGGTPQAGSIGSTVYLGGNGGNGDGTFNISGGGGGGAGNKAVGGNASLNNAGVGGVSYGGDGGAGWTNDGSSHVGNVGNVVGGGGSGGARPAGTPANGGSGASGQIRISYSATLKITKGTLKMTQGTWYQP